MALFCSGLLCVVVRCFALLRFALRCIAFICFAIDLLCSALLGADLLPEVLLWMLTLGLLCPPPSTYVIGIIVLSCAYVVPAGLPELSKAYRMKRRLPEGAILRSLKLA